MIVILTEDELDSNQDLIKFVAKSDYVIICNKKTFRVTKGQQNNVGSHIDIKMKHLSKFLKQMQE